MIESVFSSKKLSNINIAILFKRLYDDDIIEEDTFFNWVERGCSQREFLTKASPFIQWLREAEEDGG